MKLVNVTQNHIEKGVEADCYQCPVALAIEEAFALPRHIEVHVSSDADGDVAFINCLTGHQRVKRFPVWVRQRIRAFDRHEGMTPFSFKLSERRLKEIMN